MPTSSRRRFPTPLDSRDAAQLLAASQEHEQSSPLPRRRSKSSDVAAQFSSDSCKLPQSSPLPRIITVLCIQQIPGAASPLKQ